MSKLEADSLRAHQRWRSARQSLRLTKQTVQEVERAIEESRALLDRPVYPYDPRTVPKADK